MYKYVYSGFSPKNKNINAFNTCTLNDIDCIIIRKKCLGYMF